MEPIHVVCCPDNNYTMPTGVMLCSLCENNKDVELIIHVPYVDLEEENILLIKKVVESYQQTVIFYNIIKSSLPQIHVPVRQRNLPTSAYIRLFLGSILSKNIHRVLYLDGDIIVRKSITNLYNTDMLETGVAVVPDRKLSYNDIHKTYNALDYSPSLGYFNSGVLLINLDYWRENNIERQILDTIRKYMKVLYNSDQEVLNKVFCESKINLPLTYNFQHDFLAKPEYRMISWEYNHEIDETAKDPVILHYTGAKPWMASCDHPYKEEFLKYKALTIWKDVPVKGKIKWEVRKLIKKIMMWLKIPYNYYYVEWAYSYSDLKESVKS